MNMTAYEIRMSAWSSDVGSSDLDGGVVQLFTMVPSTGVVTQLAEIVGFANGESGLSFDADGNLWILNEEAGAAQVDPVTGELIAGSEVSFPSRSEEHTSELQSLMRISYAVFCLKTKKSHTTTKRPKQHRTQPMKET